MMQSKQNLVLTGHGIAPGLAHGRAFVYQPDFQPDLERYRIGGHDVDHEYARIKHAIAKVSDDLRLAAERIEQEISAEFADIFRTHEMLLYSSSLFEELRRELEHRLINAEQVVKRVFHRQEQKFRHLQDAMLSQRADDMADLCRQVLQALTGVQKHPLEKMPAGHVLMAKRLLPSDTVFLSHQAAVAVVLEEGCPAGHAALLTRELGIPTVARLANLFASITAGDRLLVDGFAGTVTIEPDPAAQTQFEQRLEQRRVLLISAKEQCHQAARTRDGVLIEVMANLGYQENASLALDYGADGIGLYRIEELYLTCKALPTETELFESLQAALAPAKGMAIHMRLLDAGGDKNPSCLNLPAEDNPFLGRRGIRLLLAYPSLLHTQLRALLRLAREYDIRILAPMVTLAEEMAQLRTALAENSRELGLAAPPLGAMIETPAAALCVRDIIQYADFLSIGTNDLTQYTMAAGRDNALVSDYFIENHPAVIRLLQILIQDTSGQVPISLCGQMAGYEDVIETLLGLGLRQLSVAPMLVPFVKQTIRQLTFSPAASRHSNVSSDWPDLCRERT